MEANIYSKIRLNSIQRSDLAASMTSWRTVHNELVSLDESNASLRRLSQMLAFEITRPEGARSLVLARVHMRINRMRERLEVAEIQRTTGVTIIKSTPTAKKTVVKKKVSKAAAGKPAH